MKELNSVHNTNSAQNGEHANDPPELDLDTVEIDPGSLAKRITSDTFDRWYQQQKFAQNIRDGKHYFNGPGRPKPANKISPSSLLQCHRKITYRQLNAPEESSDPNGIFWTGSMFEEDVILPFLEELFRDQNTYVTNSIWIDVRIDETTLPLRIKGVTDPVLVNSEGTPILPTEVKTKRSIDHIEEPNRHHKAQAYAYMYGLTEKFDIPIDQILLIYGSRDTLEIKTFLVEFDPTYWSNTVLSWAKRHVQYRTFNLLPPAEPEQDWECQYCSYRHRCGRSDRLYKDIGVTGLLPMFSEYPKEKLRDYLEFHDGAKLTPTLGFKFPDLAKEFGVYDWRCFGCGNSFDWTSIEYDSELSRGPRCPDCHEGFLRGPDPTDQAPHSGEEL